MRGSRMGKHEESIQHRNKKSKCACTAQILKDDWEPPLVEEANKGSQVEKTIDLKSSLEATQCLIEMKGICESKGFTRVNTHVTNEIRLNTDDMLYCLILNLTFQVEACDAIS